MLAINQKHWADARAIADRMGQGYTPSVVLHYAIRYYFDRMWQEFGSSLPRRASKLPDSLCEWCEKPFVAQVPGQRFHDNECGILYAKVKEQCG